MIDETGLFVLMASFLLILTGFVAALYCRLGSLVKATTVYFHKESRRIQALDLVTEDVAAIKDENKDIKDLVANLCELAIKCHCFEGGVIEKLSTRYRTRSWKTQEK